MDYQIAFGKWTMKKVLKWKAELSCGFVEYDLEHSRGIHSESPETPPVISRILSGMMSLGPVYGLLFARKCRAYLPGMVITIERHVTRHPARIRQAIA